MSPWGGTAPAEEPQAAAAPAPASYRLALKISVSQELTVDGKAQHLAVSVSWWFSKLPPLSSPSSLPRSTAPKPSRPAETKPKPQPLRHGHFAKAGVGKYRAEKGKRGRT